MCGQFRVNEALHVHFSCHLHVVQLTLNVWLAPKLTLGPIKMFALCMVCALDNLAGVCHDVVLDD